MADKAAFSSWFQEKLSNVLCFPAGVELTNYILAYETASEIREHLSSLLDIDDPESRVFIDEFFKRWTPPTTAQNEEIYKKTDHNPRLDVRKKTNSTSPYKAAFRDDMEVEDVENKVSETPQASTMVVDTRGAEFLDKNQLMPHEKKHGSPFKQKHLKFVPLFSADGKLKSDIALVPGRHPCQCLGQKHKLINNCVECGRIVCQQEGAGPCMFCGNLVCSPEDMEIISRDSKKSKKLEEKLISQIATDCEVVDESLQKAIAHKERLLDFDKNCTKRTKVLDDEADYFSADNRWLTKTQKDALAKRDAELREKRFASRRDMKFTLDFAGRKVVEDVEQNNMYDHEDAVVQAVAYGGKENNPEVDLSQHRMLDPRLRTPRPEYQHCTGGMDVTESLKAQHKCVKASLRLQDKEIQVMGDKGICLSMHQPWASLLVQGIKKLEGRSWYTAHRGRLWIASTVKVPEKEQVQHTEKEYRYIYPDKDFEFPKTYPTGTLLGCVNLVDCATNEDYFSQHPEVLEENSSPYLFVCENPEVLSIKFPVKGKHKTYKLDSHIHAAAKNMLLMT